MITIDPNIFELISDYNDGTLNIEKEKEIALLLKEDKVYRQHSEYYHTIIKAIDHAQQLEVLKDWHQENISPEEANTFDALVTNEQRIAKIKTYLFWVLGLSSIALLFFSIGYWAAPSSTPLPKSTTIPPSHPIATQSEELIEEMPLGGAGTTKVVEVGFQHIVLLEDHAKLYPPEQRQLKLILHNENQLMYTLTEQHLQLFSPNANELNISKWVLLESMGEERQFIKIGNHFYKIFPSTHKTIPPSLKDASLQKWLE